MPVVKNRGGGKIIQLAPTGDPTYEEIWCYKIPAETTNRQMSMLTKFEYLEHSVKS